MTPCAKSLLLAIFLCAVLAQVWLCEQGRAAEHPFILWSQQDLAAARKKIETKPWAKSAYEKLIRNPERHEKDFAELFRYAVTGDEEVGQAQKKQLVRMVRSPVPRGAAQYINVIRYDLLCGSLSPDERREVETCFRVYVDNHIFKRVIFDPNIFNDSANYSRYDARKYTRTNWLPNIIWPWKVSANLMAVALMDQELIRKVWSAYGSWKWYFDEYLCDTGFYGEEFSKMGSTPGAMLIYCRALERLGLNELGFGYVGKGGATMRGHIESLIYLGYPQVDLASSRPQYPMVTMGDLRQSGSSQSGNHPSPAFQHSIVPGYMPDGSGGNVRWKAHGAWGGTMRGRYAQWDGYTGFTPKMQIPLWFEIAHARWPDAGFDYFLAQMRAPDEDTYYPSLYFGLEPFDPDKVKAPSAPSAVSPQRGLVMLRADESPAYWESPAPAVAMRLATNYAHNVFDCFALAGFYAFNRPIYLNRQVTRGYAEGWSRSIQSHCGITVDGAEPNFTDATTVRKAFTEPVKFVAARSAHVYSGVDLTRSLMLTREYLLDVTHLASLSPRRYYWLLHTLGRNCPEQPQRWTDSELPGDLYPLKKVKALDAKDNVWSVTALQTCALEDPSKAKLPGQWYERKIGVTVRMLGGNNTTIYTAQTPLPVREYRDNNGRKRRQELPSEAGGLTIVAARNTDRTTFVCLHEPFQAGKGRVVEFRPIQQTGDALAVTVVGEPGSQINDRLMLRLSDDYDKPVTLSGDGESYTFTDWAYLRIGRDQVQIRGNLRAGSISVEGKEKVVLR